MMDVDEITQAMQRAADHLRDARDHIARLRDMVEAGDVDEGEVRRLLTLALCDARLATLARVEALALEYMDGSADRDAATAPDDRALALV